MILQSSNNVLPSGPSSAGSPSSIPKPPNVSSNDLASVISTPSVNVTLSSTKAASTAVIPPIYSKPTIYSANENQFSPSRLSSSSEALAENAILSKPSDSIPEQTEDKDANAESQQGAEKTNSDAASSTIELSEDELKMVEELKARDLEVRAHEQAHKSVGGQYAGAISYSYQAGPDGKRYAVGGEVPIDVAPIPGDPQATIAKMTIVSAAATAPAQPSAQDQSVAAQAARQKSEAQAELSQSKYDDISGAGEAENEKTNSDSSSNTDSVYTSNSLDKFQSISQKNSEKVNLVDTIV